MRLFSKTSILFVSSSLFAFSVCEHIARSYLPVRNVGPSFTEYDPIYGKRHKPNLGCTRITPEFTIQFSTNSLGFRGPEPRRFPERGILFLGDSFTEGYGVNDGEEFPELVRKALAQRYGEDSIPVVNTGMGDLGNGFWLKFLRNERARFKPRLVVLQMTNNDFMDNVYEHQFTLNDRDSLTEFPYLQQGSLRAIQKMLELIPGTSYSYFIGAVKQVFWTSYRGPRFTLEGHPGEADKLTYRLIGEILSLCQHEHLPVIVLAVRFEPIRLEQLQRITRKYHAQLLTTPTISQHPEFFYRNDGHWRVKGHEFVANQVLDAIAAIKILQR